jgi:ParB family transcriptional regulator, chromosome partitioning protein
MARRDVLLGITQADAKLPERQATPGYAMRGASKSMLSSIGELAAAAAKAEKLTEGEAVVDINADLIESSFVSDRMDDSDEAFQDLLEAIRARGQDSPVLLRPHPAIEGRYQVVFGHRRVRAAMQLGKPVRAVVKVLADIDHVIAQGQENSARENLSFVEKSMFTQQLLDLGFERQTIQCSLSIDAAMLTRMLSVTKRIPREIIEAVGAAKGIGRDRWIELTTLIERPGNQNKAFELIGTAEFKALQSTERFNLLFSSLASKSKLAHKRAKPRAESRSWVPADKSVAATIRNTGTAFTLALKSKDAGKFGAYISDNLDAFYRAFRETETKETGD